MLKLAKVLGLNCDGRNSIPKSSLWHYVTELQSVIINRLFSCILLFVCASRLFKGSYNEPSICRIFQ